jgi:large subunit ribosomal protein L22
MEAIAKARHLRQSPKKMRFVLDTVKNLRVNDALEKLAFMNKKAAVSISKTISSAVANMAHNNESFDADNIYITTAFVDRRDHVFITCFFFASAIASIFFCNFGSI